VTFGVGEVDAEPRGRDLEQRRGAVAAELGGEAGVIPQAEQLRADAIDQHRVGAADRDRLGRREQHLEAVAAHRRRALGEDHVGRLDLEHVDHALGELLERLDVDLARARVALLHQRDRGADLLVGAPLLAVRRRGVAVHRRALQRLDRDREHGEAVGLELGQRDEQAVVEVLGDELGDQQRRDVGALHPRQPERLARLRALDVEPAVIVERHQRHALVGAHRP
jgi:hypothetical protein